MLTKTQIEKIQKGLSGGDKSLSLLFSALSDAGRLQMLKLLLKHNDICVSDMANILGVSVPAASRQLKILEIAGLVERVRNGQMICYKVQKNNKTVKLVIDVLEKVE